MSEESNSIAQNRHSFNIQQFKSQGEESNGRLRSLNGSVFSYSAQQCEEDRERPQPLQRISHHSTSHSSSLPAQSHVFFVYF